MFCLKNNGFLSEITSAKCLHFSSNILSDIRKYINWLQFVVGLLASSVNANTKSQSVPVSIRDY